jgi:hypothetical protein
MLQKWFSCTRHHSAKDPYFLYGASNIGSMGALVAYPLIIEPYLTLNEQTWTWTTGYLALALMITLSAFFIFVRKGHIMDEEPLNLNDQANNTGALLSGAGKTTNKLRLWWVMLAFAPSSLLLGVTNYISTDIASIPLLWVAPLALYLLTFAIAFARRPMIPGTLIKKIFPFLILALAALFLLNSSFSMWTKLYAHLLAFFITALLCHGLLADKRPPAKELTEFYIWLSLGGIFGGIFNALIAPLVFNSIVEYPLMIAAVCLLRPATRSGNRMPRGYLYDLALPIIVLLVLTAAEPYLKKFGLKENNFPLKFVIAAVIICAGYFLQKRPIRLALTTGAIILAGIMFWNGNDNKLIYRERSFFGVHKVMRHASGFFNILKHGNTIHGTQFLHPELRGEPLTYYNPLSPIAEVFDKFSTKTGTRRVAIVGLGAGTLASYSRAGEHWTYYEIDPVVSEIARNPEFFTYLKDSKGTFDIIIGDARLKLNDAPDKSYDLIILDAFSSDAIPVHLLTKEALTLYTSKLANKGVLAFHTSNHYLNLRPVLSALARSEGLIAVTQTKFPSMKSITRSWMASEWTVMAKDLLDLMFLAHESGKENVNWKILGGSEEIKPWTDDFSNIISIIK